MHRREFVFSALSVTAAASLWAELETGARALGSEPAIGDPLLECLCDLVIPDSDTAGAKRAGVPRFVSLALAHGLAGSSSADHHRLETLLKEAGRGDFVSMPPSRQHDVLVAVDEAAYTSTDSVWPRIKELILMGYYTSEIGAPMELRYQLVPGRFDPDVPQGPADRASSNDWTGQRF